MANTHNETLIDLSHTITHGLVTYKGLPAPIICDYLSREASRKFYAPGTEFQIGKIEMVANTGTYLDSPFHRYTDGKDLSELELRKLADLPAIKISGGWPGFSRSRPLSGCSILRGSLRRVGTHRCASWDFTFTRRSFSRLSLRRLKKD